MSRGRTQRREAIARLKAARDHLDLHALRWDRYGMPVMLRMVWEAIEREHAAVVRAREVVRRWPRYGNTNGATR